MIEWYWLLMMMVALHVFADFHLQGILADMKQRGWWEKYECEFIKEMTDCGADRIEWIYDKDYAVALLIHSFEWAFIVCIPLMYFVGFTWQGACLVLLNTAIHAYVDDLKCNEKEINLVVDQCCHLTQIVGTLALWMMYAGV